MKNTRAGIAVICRTPWHHNPNGCRSAVVGQARRIETAAQLAGPRHIGAELRWAGEGPVLTGDAAGILKHWLRESDVPVPVLRKTIEMRTRLLVEVGKTGRQGERETITFAQP